MIINDKKNKFRVEDFEDCNMVPVTERIFSEQPIYNFQIYCLEEVMLLCDWEKRDLADVLKISISTVNNILANESMTNSKPTLITRCQFITLLSVIQKKKVENEKKILVVFYLYSWLCAGCPTDIARLFKNYDVLNKLENTKLDRDLFYRNLNNLCPNLLHSFNLFIEWRLKAPQTSMSVYYGNEDNVDFDSWYKEPSKEMENEIIKQAIQNTDKFIPLYLDWYISLF